MNGALPPSSSDSFFSVPAHCAINFLPISVDPVKVSLRTAGLAVISPPMAAAEPVTTLNDAGRNAGASAELGERQRRKRRLGGGL